MKFPRGKNRPVCQWCDHPDFRIISVEGSLVVCQCELCKNLFVAPGQWNLPDLDPDRERRELFLEILLEQILADLDVDNKIQDVQFRWSDNRGTELW